MIHNFYTDKIGKQGPSEFHTPQELLEAQLKAMLIEVNEHGCSQKRRAPLNGALMLAYIDIGEKPSLSAVVDYDPFDVIKDSLLKVTGAHNATRYDRTFKPGEGEGTHQDEHNIVVTYTQSGTANFTIEAEPPFGSHSLGAHNIIMFNGRLPHEVSAPEQGKLRSITAFAID